MSARDLLQAALALSGTLPGEAEPTAAERHRRELLAESDCILGEVEELRMARRHQLPPLLRRRLGRLLAEMGRSGPVPPTVRGAHSLVFVLQHRLMTANPRRPGVPAQMGRGAGTPTLSHIRPGVSWKVLALPDDPGGGREADWAAAVAATVDRALHRWAYAQHHAQRAARRHEDAQAAVVVARLAWNNYWDLLQDAERVLRAPGGGGAHT